MARRAIVVGYTVDAQGRWWEIREYRDTAYGLRIAVGWPEGVKRGKGGGGPRVILTVGLLYLLETFRLRPGELALPVGRSTLVRLRKQAGMHWNRDIAAAWKDRLPVLESTYGAEAARQVGRSETTVHHWLRRLGVKTSHGNGRPWSEAEIAQLRGLLAAGTPLVEISRRMGRSSSSISSKAWALRRLHGSARDNPAPLR